MNFRSILQSSLFTKLQSALLLLLLIAGVMLIAINIFSWPADAPEKDLVLFSTVRPSNASHESEHYTDTYRDADSRFRISDFVSWYEDSDGSLNFDEARALFENGEYKPIDEGKYRQNLAYHGVDGMWISFTIKEFLSHGSYALNFQHVRLNYDIYLPLIEGGYETQRYSMQEGTRQLFSTNHPIFIIDSARHAAGDVFVHIQAPPNERPIANVSIQEMRQFTAQEAARRTGAGLYVGYMLALLFFHIYVYLASKEKVFLYYSLFLISTALIRGNQQNSYWWSIIPGSNPVDQAALIVVYYLSIALGLLFVQGMLKFQQHDNRGIRIFDTIVNWFLIGLGITYLVLIFAYPVYNIYSPFLRYGSSIALILGIGYIGFAFALKNPFAPYLLIGFLPMVITGVVATVSASLDFFFRYPPLPVSFLQLADMFQTAVYALALSLRLRLLHEELDKARLCIIENQRVQQHTLEVNNHKLEEQVQSRTAELFESKNMAEQANLAKTRFLANISHELRTPLTGIIGAAELLNDSKTDKRNMCNIIIRESEHLLDLISDILGLSRIESGKLDLTYTEIDLQPFLERSLESVRLLMEQKGLDFACRIDGETSGFFCDELRLKQILVNLCGNSCKFTTEGFINVNCYRRDGFQVFEVEDSGPGIAEQDLESIFENFEQVDDASTRQFGGSGLGLSISRQITRSMGGLLEVESVPGKGSIFRLSLPLSSVDGVIPSPVSYRGFTETLPDISLLKLSAGHAPQRPKLSENAESRWKEHAILIVDDYPVNLEIATLHLQKMGAKTVTAANAADALALQSAEKYSAILLDIHIPDMDGYQIARKLRCESGINSTTPIIAITAGGFNEDMGNLYRSGMQDALKKPFRAAALEEILNIWGGAEVHGFVIGREILEEDFQDTSITESLINGFLHHLASDCELIKMLGTSESDMKEIHRIAHTVVGAAENMRLALLSLIAQDLEKESKAALSNPALAGSPILGEKISDLVQAMERTLEQN